MWRTRSPRAGARPVFLQDNLDDCVRTDLLGQQRLQSGIVGFQLSQALGIRSSHPTKRAAPAASHDTMRAAQRLDRQAGIGLTQKAADLFGAKPFLPIPSRSVERLDAKSTGDSKSGECRVKPE